jgi:hypothetical protein
MFWKLDSAFILGTRREESIKLIQHPKKSSFTHYNVVIAKAL